LSDVQLIARAQAGDRNALECLLRDIAPQLRGYLARLTGDRADDALQETLFRIWRNLGWLREPGLFRPWAYRIATREAQRLMRREGRYVTAGDDGAYETIEAPPPDTDLRQAAERLLEQVSPPARIVLAAHFLEGLTLEETAAAAEIPLGTAKSRLASGLKQLRLLAGDSA